jgi:hypothetical protein
MRSEAEIKRLAHRANSLCEAVKKAQEANPVEGSPDWLRMKEIEREAIRALDAHVDAMRPAPYRPVDVPNGIDPD